MSFQPIENYGIIGQSELRGTSHGVRTDLEAAPDAINQPSNVCFFVQRWYDQTKFVAHRFFPPAIAASQAAL
jgi:hypothetical protein